MYWAAIELFFPRPRAQPHMIQLVTVQAPAILTDGQNVPKACTELVGFGRERFPLFPGPFVVIGN